ncbi:MAG TPA: hypothetical protein VFJ18_05335, partial [Pararhizobium sp.]|nr:hypothetical protein [Pararhizobium sp.]
VSLDLLDLPESSGYVLAAVLKGGVVRHDGKCGVEMAGKRRERSTLKFVEESSVDVDGALPGWCRRSTGAAGHGH